MAPGGGREFNCTWESCGKSFNRKSDLCRHFRIHTNERPYQCMVQDCNKSFIQRSALTVHSRTHTGEKPHVCDHDGCHKAFSDSSSLARHRRIHTGKRPYICTEPTCDRSFCRKTTLTKHQHRSHRPGIATRPSSEDAGSEQSYPASVAVSVPNDSYALAQPPFYSPQSSTPSHEYYPAPRLPVAHLPAPQEPVTMMAPSLPVTSPVEAPHTHHFAHIMHPRFDAGRPPYLHSDYHHHQHHHHQPAPSPLPPPTYSGHPIGEGHPMMSFHSNYPYKQPTRILNQPEGTDWGFLGVG